jgi:hypothetical protein
MDSPTVSRTEGRAVGRRAHGAVVRLLFALLCAVLLPAMARGQGATINARLTSGVVKLGSDVKLVIEVEGARTASITKLPDVKGLRFGPINPPAEQQTYQIFGGRQSVSRSLTWVISVYPEAKGEYVLPPVQLDVDGRALATRELAFKAVQDMQGDELGLFEIDAPKEVVEGQPFTLELRFGWDSALTPQINYARLSVPWLGGLAGLLELDSPPVAAVQTTQLLLNARSRITAENLGEQRIGGRSFLVLRVRKRFLATRAGDLELTTSDFEFGRAAQDSIFGRGDPGVSYFKRSPAATIKVTRLPTAGQPLDFSGAVGTFKVTATPDRRDVDAGDSIKLTVDWTGMGNLEFFTPPDLSRMDAFKGFHVYGSNDRKSVERRSVTYDLAPLGPEVTEIPPVPLSVYDLSQKIYTTIQTAPIPIRVTPLKGTSGLGAQARSTSVVVDIRDIHTRPLSSRTPAAPGGGVLVGGAAAIAAGWLALRTAVRRRGDPDAPLERARRRARAVLARSLRNARTASDEARALRRFLADRAGDVPEAWVGRDVRAWAAEGRARGETQLTDAEALALQPVVEQLDERTWAGRDEPVGADVIVALADRLVKGGL